jgi:hypothetical protein
MQEHIKPHYQCNTSITGVTNQSVATGNNIDLEDTGIDQIATNQQNNQCFYQVHQGTTYRYNILKILYDAAAPRFLHQDILAWALEAKHTHIQSVLHLKQSSQVMYLEQWLHFEPCCHPETVELVLHRPAMQAI